VIGIILVTMTWMNAQLTITTAERPTRVAESGTEPLIRIAIDTEQEGNMKIVSLPIIINAIDLDPTAMTPSLSSLEMVMSVVIIVKQINQLNDTLKRDITNSLTTGGPATGRVIIPLAPGTKVTIANRRLTIDALTALVLHLPLENPP
jgi:hypothetical protein